MKIKILVLYVIFFFLFISFFACSDSNAPAPTITEEEKSLAINSIKEQEGVLDAAISQNNNTLSLALIVKIGTSESKAKELGENFVRLTKSFSKDIAPQNEIGKGIYDYVIGVYFPNKTEIVSGAKSSIARSITW